MKVTFKKKFEKLFNRRAPPAHGTTRNVHAGERAPRARGCVRAFAARCGDPDRSCRPATCGAGRLKMSNAKILRFNRAARLLSIWIYACLCVLVRSPRYKGNGDRTFSYCSIWPRRVDAYARGVRQIRMVISYNPNPNGWGYNPNPNGWGHRNSTPSVDASLETSKQYSLSRGVFKER